MERPEDRARVSRELARVLQLSLGRGGEAEEVYQSLVTPGQEDESAACALAAFSVEQERWPDYLNYRELQAKRLAPTMSALVYCQLAEVADENQVAALPETAEGIDGTWVLEIREPTYIPEASKVTVEVVDGRFTANVSKNGWRGEVSGEIDHSGTLVAWGYLRSLANAEKALLKWSVAPSGSTYSATIPASTNWLTMTFDVSLYR